MGLMAFHAYRMGRRLVMVHGAHWTGVDLHVKTWCDEQEDLRRFGWLVEEPYPANWARYRKGAGPIRNGVMVAKGGDLCLAYPKGESSGTRGCAQLARDALIPTLVTEWGPTVATTLESRLRAAGITILEGS
jgi:hypothetical protein